MTQVDWQNVLLLASFVLIAAITFLYTKSINGAVEKFIAASDADKDRLYNSTPIVKSVVDTAKPIIAAIDAAVDHTSDFGMAMDKLNAFLKTVDGLPDTNPPANP